MFDRPVRSIERSGSSAIARGTGDARRVRHREVVLTADACPRGHLQLAPAWIPKVRGHGVEVDVGDHPDGDHDPPAMLEVVRRDSDVSDRATLVPSDLLDLADRCAVPGEHRKDKGQSVVRQ